MSHSWLCYRKQRILSTKLHRDITLEEVHILCEELGFTDPEETMRFIEEAPAHIIENLIYQGKKKRKRKKFVEEYDRELEYAYATA